MIIITAVVFNFGKTQTQAQEIRLNAYSGYSFDDRVNTYYSTSDYYEGRIEGSYRWGFDAEYLLQQRYGLALNYSRQDTKAPIRYYQIKDRQTTFDLGIDWITLAGTHYFKVNETVEPYAGIMGGVAIFNIRNPDSELSQSVTRFGWGLRMGTNIFFSESLGIKFQADLLSAAQAVGGGVYFGTGGAGTAVSTYSSMLQFTLGGGLVYRFGK
ncbi:outer membrane beta-barrel protein [Pedobacter endophyticus]|uniref:Outer membrane beta-barrel protein n=2 Tax=Pedobacter endophyticus TaxID=2789740 RepID=A0A7S9Q0U2_9SPHI|nr:outer membrane beta-barrel protein [Pedobacter endophyticus]